MFLGSVARDVGPEQEPAVFGSVAENTKDRSRIQKSAARDMTFAR
jgi:hypothetical protein